MLIHKTMAIDMVDLLGCEVSYDWVIVIKFSQWMLSSIPYQGNTNDNKSPAELQDVKEDGINPELIRRMQNASQL